MIILMLLGALGIAIFVFIVTLVLSDRPVKTFFVALMLSYVLTTMLIYILNRIAKRKEEKQ
jgi:membrane protein implicated in regulation of membrane protease activity